jgi:hypothetical protein
MRENAEDTIKVAIRVRPFLKNENIQDNVIYLNDDCRKIKIGKGNSCYESSFNKVFQSKSTQEEIFNFIKPITKDIFLGINTSILAYGQTGSGKTYTMFGSNWTGSGENRKIFHDDMKQINLPQM